jgi:hypothetical protein
MLENTCGKAKGLCLSLLNVSGLLHSPSRKEKSRFLRGAAFELVVETIGHVGQDSRVEREPLHSLLTPDTCVPTAASKREQLALKLPVCLHRIR